MKAHHRCVQCGRPSCLDWLTVICYRQACTTSFPYLQAARDRFNSFLKQATSPADEADIERLRRERREAANKGALLEELPEQFWKLPRIRFLLILCKEILHINR
jgi:hypothetical protein